MRILFTGASGSGKSTTLNRLKEIGFNVVEEQARILISDLLINDESKLPWNNREAFQCLLEDLQKKCFLENDNHLFDRGIVDEIAFRSMNFIDVPTDLSDFCYDNRYDLVFMFHPNKAIYVNDDVRRETYEESCNAFYNILTAYWNHNYDIIRVPNTSIEERVEFITNKIKEYNIK